MVGEIITGSGSSVEPCGVWLDIIVGRSYHCRLRPEAPPSMFAFHRQISSQPPEIIPTSSSADYQGTLLLSTVPLESLAPWKARLYPPWGPRPHLPVHHVGRYQRLSPEQLYSHAAIIPNRTDQSPLAPVVTMVVGLMFPGGGIPTGASQLASMLSSAGPCVLAMERSSTTEEPGHRVSTMSEN